jgi:hypothetical protein
MNTRTRDIFLTMTLTLTCVVVIFVASIVYAQCQTDVGAGGFVPLECFSPSSKLAGAYNTNDFGKFLNRLFVGAISLGAILAVLRLAWAGFVYMGTDMWGKKEHAKEIITDTLLGLFLLLAIWLILHQINPQILSLNVTANAPKSSSGTEVKAAPADFSAPNAGAPPGTSAPTSQSPWCAQTGITASISGCFATQQDCEANRSWYQRCFNRKN